MATFVLVHGAWNGGWCWRKIAPLLRQAGHEVFTPTLTGLGERAHLASPDIGLGTHIQDLVGVLEWEGLHGTILVGHSFGGVAITGVAERAAARLAHLVYLDATVPRDGESRRAMMGETAWAGLERSAREGGDGWRLPPPAITLPDPDDARWVASKLVPQPLRTYAEPLRLRDPAALALPRTYTHGRTGNLATSFAPFAARARWAGWRCRELSAEHLCYATAPRETADLLLEIAALP